MKAHRYITISTDDLPNGTCVVIELDEKTDKICICRDLKELKIFPYIEKDVLEQ